MTTDRAITEQRLTVVVQDWEESKSGRGTISDGFSIHLNENNRETFIKEYWHRQPKGDVPEEYSRPCEQPYLADVDDETFFKLQKSKNGIRGYENPPAVRK